MMGPTKKLHQTKNNQKKHKETKNENKDTHINIETNSNLTCLKKCNDVICIGGKKGKKDNNLTSIKQYSNLTCIKGKKETEDTENEKDTTTTEKTNKKKMQHNLQDIKTKKYIQILPQTIGHTRQKQKKCNITCRPTKKYIKERKRKKKVK